jgi:NADH-quinone oxidoreductase subunit A
MVDLTQYLPILICSWSSPLVLSSSAFRVPAYGRARLTGAHQAGRRQSSANMNAAFPRSRTRAASSTCASTSSRSSSSSSTSKRPFCSPGRSVFKDLGWAGWITMMIFIAELAIGLVYAWKVGALDWE